MDPKFKVWLESRNLKAEDVLADASQLAEHLATYEREIAEAEKPPAVPAPEAVPGDDAATVAQAALTAERTRVKSIREIGKAQGIESDAIDVFIDDGNSLEETRAKVLDVLADRSQALGGNIEVTADGREKRAKAMSSAMQFRTGIIGRDKIEEGGEEFCGLTLKEFARDCLERSGNSTRSLSDHAFSEMALRGPKLNSDSIRAFAQRGEVIAGSTSDFPYILAATANKSLLDAYNTAKSTWEQWCSSGSLSDFKEAGRIKLSDMGDLEVVPEGGHYPEGKASDSREPIQLKTYGKRFSITRQAIINDDLSAFTRIPASMGSAARRVPDQLAIALLLSNPTMSDGHALFSAGHNNLSQVAGNRPDTLAHALAGLQALSLLLSKQTAFLATLEEDDSDTLYLDLEPSVWFGGPTYTWNRKTVATSAGSVEDDKNAGVSNAAADMGLTVLQTAKLEDTNITGNSAYSHYLFARPSDAAVIEVAFLQGNREPYMEETDQTDVDGRIMKVRMDCVAGVVDYVGAVKETGV